MAEFQIVDQATAVTNEEGENSHLCYKERQRTRVQERLQYGQHIQQVVNVQASTGSHPSESSSDSDQPQ
jgi:(p)ppGpp synthase/HD superfamily hydrolase